MLRLALSMLLTLWAGVALAQSPYAGLQTRLIKALSEQQISDLKAGRGMGLALPAELNGYPGPLHVLDLADRLSLTASQRTEVQALVASMKAEAIPLGEQLITLEDTLDRQFAERTVTAENLGTTTAQIGQLQGQLRNAHLKYHLATAELLSADQRKAYASLRGYSATHQGHGQRH